MRKTQIDSQQRRVVGENKTRQEADTVFKVRSLVAARGVLILPEDDGTFLDYLDSNNITIIDYFKWRNHIKRELYKVENKLYGQIREND